MKKDFQEWHKKKAVLHDEKERPFFHEMEIWFCSLGSNIGYEQDGRGEKFLRPVIILKKFNQEVCWILPLTKSERTGQHYFSFQFNGQRSNAILSQIRLIDGKRLQYKFGNLDREDFKAIKKRLMQFLA